MSEILLKNCRVYTMDESVPYAEQILLKNGKIAQLGTRDDNLASNNSVQEMDLGGQTVLPGLNDSHLHLLSYGMALSTVDLSDVSSFRELIAKVQNYIDNNNIPKHEWVIGQGFDEENLQEKDFPTREILDQISQCHPVIVKRKCTHVSGVNSYALDLAGITAEDNEKIEGGKVYLDQDGKPNGVLAENAQNLLSHILPSYSEKDLEKYIKLAGEAFIDKGLTSVQSDDLKAIPGGEDMIMNAYLSLAEKGELPVKVNLQLQLSSEEEITTFIQKYSPYFQSSVTDYLNFGPLKVLLDGSLGGKTAALRQPYLGDQENFGIVTYTPESLDSLLDCAARHHLQIACHGIGDYAIELFLDSIDKIQAKFGGDYRHRIIHCQLTDLDLINRIARQNISVDAQPDFVGSDYGLLEERLGFARSINTYAWKTMLDKGINVSGSSDCPVEPFDPRLGIKAAVTRQDANNNPCGGWHPWEKVSVFEALKMYTVNSAYATFEEQVKGKLAPGYCADMVVLEEDPYSTPPQELDSLSVNKVFINGKIVK
ncbi:amidohydrolase [Natranaerobius thermophilus]|uniref:Amidohydrolase 3 n=1 Tax=Natranaerobius thermophilus (strain ATCC BAA-1301 / DSM 18059 / JW/NM-WN-LF) TaxID=457570 RepID=B2A5S9_NATTJ|nr:amidohydrolase [Natranaerobius thermophilus]ACB84022.1 Amidohydrolase 3 [Natranaerobius thermophilus JW/NM-WN-LF]